MPNTIPRAQPSLKFIPPALNSGVLGACKPLLPWWIKFKTPIADIQGSNVESLLELYRQFQERKIRFILAFRHPSTLDPFAIAYLLWQLLPKTAKNLGVSLQSQTHAHFIYDRGIPLWAGAYVGWIFSKLGGIPIMRGKIDRLGLRSARQLFATGQFPMAVSPEGGTNGHNEIISPLEPGIAQMGFWCVEDLLESGRTEEVFIVPLGIQYSYLQENWTAIEELLTRLEADCGLSPYQNNKDNIEIEGINTDFTIGPVSACLYPRLIRLGDRLLSLMEDFYRQFYHQQLSPDRKQDLATRLQAILDLALTVAEQYFSVKPKGTLIDRCRRLEQAGWDYIYRQDIKNTDSLSPIEWELADRVAEEASLRMWHMRLVESFVAVTGRYVREKPTFGRFAETALLISKTIARIKGDNAYAPQSLGNQKVLLTVGKPISVTSRWQEYKSSRRQAVANITEDLQAALEEIIS